jgi:hypothetical protein
MEINNITITGDINTNDYNINCSLVKNDDRWKYLINFQLKEHAKQKYNKKNNYKYKKLCEENEKLKKDNKILLLEKELSELKNK